MIPEWLVLIVMVFWFAFWICGKYHDQQHLGEEEEVYFSLQLSL